MAGGTASVWRNRAFRLVWGAQTLSDLGSGVSQLAYPLLMLALTGSTALAGALSAARAVPYLLLGLPAGALVDRWDRKRVMIACDVGRAIAMGSLPCAAVLGHLGAVQLFGAGVVGGVFSVFFSAAESACLSAVVGTDQLTAAAAAQQATSSAGGVAAPPLGGGLLQLWSGLPFLVDALSYVASAVALSAVPIPFGPDRQPVRASLRSDIRDGVTWLWSRPVLRDVALAGAGLQLAISAVALVVIVAAQHAHASPAVIGVLFSAVGIGGFTGSVLAPRLKTRFGFGPLLLAVVWIHAVLWVLLAFSSSLVLLGLVLVLFTTSMPVFGVASRSYRLTVTPQRLLGRVGTVFTLVVLSAAPLGTAGAGLLLGWLGTTGTSLVFAGWVFVLAITVRDIRKRGDSNVEGPKDGSRLDGSELDGPGFALRPDLQ